MNKRFCALLVIVCISTIACKKNDEPVIIEAEEYYPLQVGRTMTYMMDSAVYANFGSRLDTIYYLAKDSIIDNFKDNQNQDSYTVWRFTRDTFKLQPWKYSSTYYVTKANNGIEVVDNNLRYIKLKTPVREFFSWKGNSYIETKSATSQHRYLDEWNYEYQNVEQSFKTRYGTLKNTITVFQQDELVPEGPFNPGQYQQKNYSIEVYAKGIGLVYKRFLHWTWQPNPPGFEADAYGIRLNLIDYK